MKVYKFLYKILAPIFRIIFNVHAHGEENIPEEGGLLICPNHISAPDVIMVAVATRKRPINFMAKAEVFKVPVLGLIVKALGAYPIRRGEGDVGAIRKTISLLKEGRTVGMFPQGTRYKGVDPHETSIKHGAGMIAHRAGVPVLPVAIITKGYKVSVFKRVDVIFGKPILPSELGFESGSRADQAAASEKIFTEILKLHEAGVPKK
ncbi:MAG: 1-acyl-sn-glycerol-3-phosphate acyltransferase [Clostridia bacterium]|nr:1-acyl-sn-glycerol-3-phosphate acyltransferase [Clostridia bacterium]